MSPPSPTSSASPAPARSRRRAFSVVAIALLMAAGVFIGATLYTSRQTARIQQEQIERLQTQLASTSYGRITGTSYRQGLFSSTQTVQITLGKAGAPDSGTAIVLTNDIQHGPLPGLHAVGNALIHSHLSFADPALEQKLQAALGGQEPVIRTLVDFHGGTQSHVLLPKGEVSDEGKTVAWQPLQADVARDALTTSVRMTWPGVKITAPQGELGFTGLEGKGSQRKESAGDLLGVGEQVLSVKRMYFTSHAPTAAGALTLNDLVITQKSTLDGGFYNAVLLNDIGQLSFAKPGEPPQNYSKAQLHLSATHLSRDALAHISATLAAAEGQANAQPGRPPSFTEAQQKALAASAVRLLKAQPVLAIDRLSLTQPSGEILLSAKVELPGASDLSQESAQMLLAFPLAAAGMAQVQARLDAPQAALLELLQNFSTHGAELLDHLIQSGMLQREGGKLVGELRFKQGEASVNGRPLLDQLRPLGAQPTAPTR